MYFHAPFAFVLKIVRYCKFYENKKNLITVMASVVGNENLVSGTQQNYRSPLLYTYKNCQIFHSSRLKFSDVKIVICKIFAVEAISWK